jgi:D-lyxose ketol-isomerase
MNMKTTLTLLACAAVCASTAMIAPQAMGARRGHAKVMTYNNSDFYTNGKFNEAKAKEAYFAMMKRFDYPCPKNLHDNMWVLDFHVGHFTDCGMGGIFWLNSQEGGYCGHEIFLLPGQMIPEHSHHATKKGPAKDEGWHVRYGSIHVIGEGTPSPGWEKVVPASQHAFISVKHMKELEPGEVASLNRKLAHHFMVAGPQGAIVSEYATFHDSDGVRFQNPNVHF